MTHIHYKFSSKLGYNTLIFDGPNITLRDLKIQIMEKEKLRAAYCDLQITDAQSNQEYIDEDSTIPKGSSVIVRRIPIAGTKSGMNCSKTRNIERTDVWQQQRFHGADKAMADQTSTSDLLFFSEMADPDVSEEDKIRAMIKHQSSYDFMNYNCGTVLPTNYTCYRCGNTGHHIRNCPYNKDKNADTPVRIKKSSGIPRSFLVEVDDPNIKGAMLTNSGRFAIPAIDAEAYAVVKKEKLAFVPAEPEEPEDEQDPVPEVLRCLICCDLLSDAVVIPCCANSYCDDCIRSALLESEEHVCPTCHTPEVSPDTLIANKFLRQAVNNYKTELGGTKSQKKGNVSSILQHLNLTQSPTLTLPTFMQSQPLKPHKPIKSQEAADAWISSQECETPPAAAGSASASNTPSKSPETVQLHPEMPEESNEKRQDDSAAASPSGVVSNTSAPSQPQVDPPQAVVVNQQESSSGSLSEPTPQQLLPPSSSSSSSYPSTPSPIFPPSHFHPFPPLSGYPPGYPPATPVWTFPTLKGAPISSLCSSSSSNPSLMPSDWYKNQREERSPHRGSSYRRSSEFSKSKSSHSYPSSRSRSRSRSRSKSRSRYRCSSESFKSKSSHSYPSSRSRSRSRSRPKDRSGPHSPSSRHRDQHIRPRSSQSYSYGYKRSHSPTTSSSSSPRAGHHSRCKSPSGHRHHRKKSATSSSRSKRGGGEHYHREQGGSTESSAGYMFPQYADQMSSLELDRQRYLQWREEYKKWCEKYLQSYMEHFNQLPPLPPCPFSPSGDKEKSRTHSHDQGRRSSRTHSQTSSDSCSLSYQSSSDSSSKSSPSSSDVSSSPTHSSKNSRSPPSQSSSYSRSAHSEGGAQEMYDSARADAQREESEEAGVQEGKLDGNQLIVKTIEDLSPEEHKRQGLKHHTQRAGEESDAADFMGNKSHAAAETDSFNVDSKVDNSSSKEALKPVQQLLITDQCSDRGCERKSEELRDVDGEREQRRDTHSDSRQDLEIKHKEKSVKKTHRRDRDGHREPKASDSRSEKNRKRKEDDTQRSPDDGQSSECLKTKTAKHPETLREEHLCPSERNTWPPTKKGIWEEGMKVKPQKKISINIKLNVKPKEDETKKQDQSALNNETEQRVGVLEERKVNRGETEIHENKDSSRDQGGAFVEKIKSEAETGLMLEEYTLREEKGAIVTEKDDFQLWQCVPKGDEEEESKNRWVDKNRTEACKGEEVLNDQRRNTREGKEEDQSERNGCRGEEKRGLVLIAQQEEMTAEEKGTNLPEKSELKETLNTSVSNGRSSEECREKQRAVKTLENCTDVRSAEDELIQVTRSKWEKEEYEEEEFLPSQSVSVTAETTTNRQIEGEKEEQRQRSVKIERYKEERGRERHVNSTHRGLAPSSGRDRPDSSSYVDRKREKGRENERQRDRDKEGKVRIREGEKEKDKRERGHKRSFPSSSHSMSHDTKRRDRPPKSSSRPGGEFSSGKSSTSDQNTNRADRNTSRSRDGFSSSRERDCSRSSGGSEPRKARRSSPAQELTQSRSRHESRVETGRWKEERMRRIRKERTEH